VDQAERQRLNQDLARLADGDREAFHPVFVRLRPLLARFAARHLPADAAEDVAQEALLRVFSRLSEFDPARDALSWAFGIAAWEIRSARQRERRRREEPATALADRPADGPGPEQSAISSDLAAAMDAALAELEPGVADTLWHYAIGTRPSGVAPAAFRKRVERGLARLREAWRGKHGAR